MYVDDLKTYHKSYNKAALMARTLKDKFEDIGLYWGLEKCATMNVVRRKIEQSTKAKLMHTQINLYLSFSSSIFSCSSLLLGTHALENTGLFITF